VVSFNVGEILTITADFCTSVRHECELSYFDKGELIMVVGYSIDTTDQKTVVVLTNNGIKQIYAGIMPMISTQNSK